MTVAILKSAIATSILALNYRTSDALRKVIREIKHKLKNYSVST
jgi:hypothetical protein